MDCLGDGLTAEQIIEKYPSLSTAAVRAAAAYRAKLAREEMLPLTVDR